MKLRRIAPALPPQIPLVSVAMLAFNHEAYLAEAIESVLSQDFAGPIEIVVGDDCSTDGTKEILTTLAERHPGIIRMLVQGENVGMHGNLEAVLGACRGTYVALLEGDDFWTDPTKLTRQVNALENDSTLVGSYHLVENFSDEPGRESSQLSHSCYREDSRLQFEDLLWSCGMPTCSVVFRRCAWGEYPRWMTALPVADWPLFLLLARSGDFLFLPLSMAAYRVHAAGSWTSLNRERRVQTLLDCYLAFFDVFGKDSRLPLLRGLLHNVSRAVRYMEECGDDRAAVRRALEAFIASGVRFRHFPAPSIVWWWFRLRFPTLHNWIYQRMRRHARNSEARKGEV